MLSLKYYESVENEKKKIEFSTIISLSYNSRVTMLLGVVQLLTNRMGVGA